MFGYANKEFEFGFYDGMHIIEPLCNILWESTLVLKIKKARKLIVQLAQCGCTRESLVQKCIC